MKKNFIYILMLAGMLAGCRDNGMTDEPQPVPQYDTTIIPQTRIDTILVRTDTTGELIPRENDNIVLAYVTYYGADRDRRKIDKSPAAYDCVTHINYAFCELYVRDSVYQKFALQGSESRFREVLQLKEKNPNLKILVSFTHCVDNDDNFQAGGFSVMSADSAQRRHFAEDCLAFCQKWGIDGIDIDWEFPTISWSGHACSPEDSKNYTLLMKQLRETLGSDYLLTYAGYPENNGWIDNMAVEPYVDWVNVMCYDLCSAPSPHNAIQCSGYWDIRRTLQDYQKVGYPMNKLVLGIPFYGRHDWGDGEYHYSKILTLTSNQPSVYSIAWNDTWKVPYMKKNGAMFCSFDDPRSIRIKSDWVFEHGWRGLMYWEASGDDNNRSLARACWEGQKYIDSTHVTPVWRYDTIQYNDTIITRKP